MQVRAAEPDGDEGGGDPGDLGDRAARHLHGLPLLPRAGARQVIITGPPDTGCRTGNGGKLSNS